MSDKSVSKASNDAELKSAIVAFEQILDAEPNDRLALETLGDAYERMDDRPKALVYLIRLAEVVANENDTKMAPELVNRLKAFGATAEIQAAQNRLHEVINKGTANEAATRAEPPARRSHDITREVSLAWDLLQAGEITQEEYATVVQDLSENSTKTIDVPVTVLHVLQDRNFKNLERVLAFLTHSSGVPFISLAHFELQPDLARMLPADYMSRRGAIVYEKLGRDLLVAVLNPLDADLQADVRKVTDRRCHFYLTSAADYDSTLTNLRKMQSGA